MRSGKDGKDHVNLQPTDRGLQDIAASLTTIAKELTSIRKLLEKDSKSKDASAAMERFGSAISPKRII